VHLTLSPSTARHYTFFPSSLHHPHLHSFPTRRSSDLLAFAHSSLARRVNLRVAKIHHSCREVRLFRMQIGLKLRILRFEDCFRTDRKSTRLNSSHLGISYAVFCLKKKKSASRFIAFA